MLVIESKENEMDVVPCEKAAIVQQTVNFCGGASVVLFIAILALKPNSADMRRQ